jgi:hypothetical protein
VSKRKSAPPPSIHSEPSSAEESDGGLSEQLPSRHSPQPGSAREPSPDYQSDEEVSPTKPHVPSDAVEAPRADSHGQSDSSSDHSHSSSSGSDEDSEEGEDVVSGDKKQPANPFQEMVEISSDSEPDKEANASGNSQEQARSASSPQNVTVSQALSSPRKFTVGSGPAASPKLADLSDQVQEHHGNQPPQSSVSLSKRDKKFLLPPHGDSARHAPADEGQADGSPEEGKLDVKELEGESPERRREERKKIKARKEKLQEARRQSETSAQRTAEIPAPGDRASPPNQSSEQEGANERAQVRVDVVELLGA